ncbi:MAG: LacI family DNA-binding transcriptional regulator [Lachnospiraceae bacterium]
MAEVKLKDIAEVLGVSVVTVSNALLGKAGVSDKLREKVVEQARVMGYDCRRYDKQQGQRIGIVVSDKYLTVGASFYWEMYQHVAYASSKRNSTTIIEILEEQKCAAYTPKMVLDKNVDGILVIGWMNYDFVKRLVEKSGLPVVLLDFQYRDLHCDAVMSSNYIGSYKATRYLLEQGHRKIAFVGSVKANENILDRFYGYRKGMEEFELSVRKDWILEDRDIVTGDKIPMKLPREMPTAFVCNSDWAAGHLYNLLRDQGYRVPQDISIVGYDNYLYNHPFAKELTTFHVDMKRMAEEAVKLLIGQIKGKEKYCGVHMVDGKLIIRNSVRPLS